MSIEQKDSVSSNVDANTVFNEFLDYMQANHSDVVEWAKVAEEQDRRVKSRPGYLLARQKIANEFYLKYWPKQAGTNPQMMAATHVDRLHYTGFLQSLENLLDAPMYELLKRICLHPHLCMNTCVRYLCAVSDGMETIARSPVDEQSDLPDYVKNASTNASTVFQAVAFMRWNYSAQTAVFKISDRLDELIDQTDISPEVRASELRLPYPSVFLQFGSKPSGRHHVWNPATQEHALEGVYIFEQQIFDRAMVADFRQFPKPARELWFVACGAPKSCVGDDALYTWMLTLEDDEQSLEQVLQEHFELAAQTAQFGASLEGGVLPKGYTDGVSDIEQTMMRDICLKALKSLLFLNTKEVQSSISPERQAAFEKIKSIHNADKLRKAKDRAYKAQNTIHIDLTPEVAAELGQSGFTGTGTGVKPHWRRGHLRRQPFGSGRKEIKVVWIKPVLVGFGGAEQQQHLDDKGAAGSISSSDLEQVVKPKEYRVDKA